MKMHKYAVLLLLFFLKVNSIQCQDRPAKVGAKPLVIFSITNNQQTNIVIHTGKGITNILPNASYRFEKQEGTEIYLSEPNGTKIKILFVVNRRLQNKNIKTSELALE